MTQEYSNNKTKFYKKYLKRVIDVLFAMIFLILLSPLLLLIYLTIKITMGSPVIFKQDRPGINGEIFTIYKFRTMKTIDEAKHKRVNSKNRITKVGSFLRNTSLDELPELINIIKGDMSFIGPRPLLVQYLDRYNSFQKQRHLVKPGMTGLAQVNGRNLLSWEKKFQYDVCHAKNISFYLDIKIFFKTILVLWKRRGVNNSEAHTMTEFKGYNSF